MTTFLILACAFEEDLPEKDIVGKVVIPREAATRMTVADPDGDGTLEEPVETTDPRLIGPVYIGAYSAIDENSFSYPHPAMGPIITADEPGNTFPYGGTTVGRFDFACYEALACRVSTGRFEDYASLLDWFANHMGRPVVDQEGEIVDYPSTFQQACYEYFEVTSDQEISFIGDVDFEPNDDGDFEATFLLPHTLFVEGMSIWGWMDTPEISTTNADVNPSYSTCNSLSGRNQYEYDEEFEEGVVYYDLLNFPSNYIADRDWVSSGVTIDSVDEQPTLVFDIQVGADSAEEE